MVSANKSRHTGIVDVHLFLLSGRQILLGLRQNTGFEDGKFHLPSGHLEQGETVIQALVREAHEELGIIVSPSDVTLAYVMHRTSTTDRLGFFFSVNKWEGEVENREPEKCALLRWFNIDDLPQDMVLYAKEVIENYKIGKTYSLNA